jgi:RNA polymerase sigma factor (sigma-70 family)
MVEDLLSNNRSLLARFRKGEEEAMVAVWNAYLPLVASLAHRGFGSYPGLRSPADVDDLIAATFLAAFETSCRERYDGLTPYGSFLLGIARNLLRRSLKLRAREPVVEPGGEFHDPGVLQCTPEESLLREEEIAAMQRFPATLDSAEREVWLGYHRDGLSEEALAVELKCTRHRVRKTLKRAERKFRRYVRELGMEP